MRTVKTQTLEREEFIDEYGKIIMAPRYIKRKGNPNIIEKESDYDKIAFEIDGEIIEAEQLEDLLTPYIGFQLQYVIRDAGDPVLGEDEYLVPVKITEETLKDELETAINIHTDRGGFFSYSTVMALDQAIYPILDKLQILAESDKRDSAIRAGKAMMRRLNSVEHDDDYFPVYHLEAIAGIIDPQKTDEEVQELLLGEE